jgi:hypothetical protein
MRPSVTLVRTLHANYNSPPGTFNQTEIMPTGRANPPVIFGRPRKFIEDWACSLLGVAKGVQVDAELLALFVEVAALEAQGAGDVGHVEIVATDFGEEHFAFEGFGALFKSSPPRCGAVGEPGGDGESAGGESLADVIVGYRVFGGEQHDAFDDVAELADIAGPGVAAEFGDGVVREYFFFPTVLFRDLTREVGDERGKIFVAFAKWRKG